MLGVHDWGGLIGLRWACDHPGAVAALVLSDTGFFGDGSGTCWRRRCAPRQGEQLVDGITSEAFGQHVEAGRQPGIGPMTRWTSTGGRSPTSRRRRGMLELYRSGEFP